jgi:hypothetical protein
LQAHPPNTANSPSPTPPSLARRRVGIAAFAGLTIFLCSGATSPTACPSGNIGPSSGEIIGVGVAAVAVVGVGVVVAVEVSKNHHTLNGCVVSGPAGIEIVTSDSKRYSLEGNAASIKVGDRVKIHGSRVKKTKDTAGDQVYRIDQLKKDYGPCPASMTAPSHTAP